MRVLLVGLLALVASCGDPIMILPGGALNGDRDRRFRPTGRRVADVKTIQVEFRPKDPYSHNIWGVGIEPGSLYRDGREGHALDAVHRGGSERARARRHRVCSICMAVPVTDEAERTRVAEAYTKQVRPESRRQLGARRIDLPARSARLSIVSAPVNDSVFFESAFLALVASSILAPGVIFGLMLWKRAMSRTTVLLFGVMLIVLSGIDVALLVTLGIARRS